MKLRLRKPDSRPNRRDSDLKPKRRGQDSKPRQNRPDLKLMQNLRLRGLKLRECAKRLKPRS